MVIVLFEVTMKPGKDAGYFTGRPWTASRCARG